MAERSGTAGEASDGTAAGAAGAAPRHRVRRAEPADVPAMDAMVRELAAYEREPDAVQASPRDLHEALFAEGASVGAHVGEVATAEGWAVAGMAVWFTTYSTWTGRHGTWLEDLYVRPEHRGAGLGRALLAALAAEAVEGGRRRVEWAVLDWNTPAQRVYAAVGARPQEEWTTWRLTGAALEGLARTGAPASTAGGARETMAGRPEGRADEGATP